MFTLNCKGRLLVIDKPVVMGIINATPDSFYEGSRFTGTNEILLQAEKMINEGADIIDIGGQSTRPGSEKMSEEQELKRVLKAIEIIHQKFPGSIISIDTYFASVAKHCVEAGASMVNDISSGTLDNKMLETVAALKVPYIAMHMKGNPQNMQQLAKYDNVTREVLDFFIQKKEECINAGIFDLIIDPGFGFAKTARHNFEIIKNLSVFEILELPVLIGVSRKSSIYKTLGISTEEALNGTTVLHTIALMNGVNILRTHDAKEAKEAIKLFEMVNGK
jgi:dihydropteroate synthase